MVIKLEIFAALIDFILSGVIVTRQFEADDNSIGTKSSADSIFAYFGLFRFRTVEILASLYGFSSLQTI